MTTLTMFPKAKWLRSLKGKGATCRFFNLDGIGLKLYRRKETRDRAFANQEFVYHLGIAPRVGNTFTVTLKGKTWYGYTTEIVEQLVETDGRHGNEAKDGSDVYIQLKRRADADELRDKMRECQRVIIEAGCCFPDSHPGNYGFLNGRLVLIDFDCVEIPEQRAA